MAVVHIVLFKLKSSLSEAETKEASHTPEVSGFSDSHLVVLR